MRFTRSTRTNQLALFVATLLLTTASAFVTGCNSPNSAPASGTNALSTSSYAGALEVSDTLRGALGDSLCRPSPFLLPAAYLQQQLGLTDSQTLAIQNIQDSLQAAFRTAIDAQRASGTINKDSIRALVQQFKTALEAAITPLLSPTELATLMTLAPPMGGGRHGHGPDFGGPRHERGGMMDTSKTPPSPLNDSLVLVHLTKLLTLTDAQVASLKAVQDSLRADTALTMDGRRDAFRYNLTLTLTQISSSSSQPILWAECHSEWVITAADTTKVVDDEW